MAASLNCSATRATAQAVHGAAPAPEGRNRAKPVPLPLSEAMLWHWLRIRDDIHTVSSASTRVDRTVAATFESGIATAVAAGYQQFARAFGFAETSSGGARETTWVISSNGSSTSR
ncbi:hypothetical protein [Nocardia sp. NPDC057227]|uniref:hypothetical protein n=1 Tax=Nocardia sp. NPDC057227 TaxID=3346056 RepID=UPI0036438AB6